MYWYYLFFFHYVNEKLINWSKKEKKNFIQAKFEYYNSRRASHKLWLFCPLEVKSQLYKFFVFFKIEGYIENDILLKFTLSRSKYHLSRYKIKKRYYLLRSCLDAALLGWAAISANGEVCPGIMPIHNAQCGREVTGQRKFLCLNVSCLAIK